MYDTLLSLIEALDCVYPCRKKLAFSAWMSMCTVQYMKCGLEPSESSVVDVLEIKTSNKFGRSELFKQGRFVVSPSLNNVIKSIRSIVLELDRVSILGYTRYIRGVKLVTTAIDWKISTVWWLLQEVDLVLKAFLPNPRRVSWAHLQPPPPSRSSSCWRLRQYLPICDLQTAQLRPILSRTRP